MSQQIVSVSGRSSSRAVVTEEYTQYITVQVGRQLCGFSVMTVQDVLRPHKIAHIPLAPEEVAGSLNLRGRIVTAIDLRLRMDVELTEKNKKAEDCMSVVVEHQGELYSLLVDSVGEVLTLPDKGIEKTPATLESHWRSMSKGVYRLEDKLLVILDVHSLLDFAVTSAH